jgi:predicted NAD/FAD-dependent oxidoreductase
MASRRIADGVFDHGAQYFTARDARFRTMVQEWAMADRVRSWSQGFALADGGFKADHDTRWCGRTGMTSVPKHLAETLDVHLGTVVTSVQPSGKGWLVTTRCGREFWGRALLLTAPVPQSLALMSGGGVRLPPPVQKDLERIDYGRCLALLVRLPGSSRIPAPGGLWFHDSSIAWMADNQQKGVSSADWGAVTIHASPAFSLNHWDTPQAKVSELLLSEAEQWLAAEPTEIQLHRWRYSLPLHVHPERCVVLHKPALLVLAGDAFGGPRVEGAALSGLSAGTTMAEMLA